MRALLDQFLSNRAESATFVKYAIASVLSLGMDLLIFFILLKVKVPAVVAASVSYSCGILCHWAVSSRLVFVDTVSRTRAVRHYQKVLFVGSALLGLLLTSAIVALGTTVGMRPQYAKAVAIVLSFLVTWLVRRNIVFGQRLRQTARLERALGLKAKQ